VIKNIFFIFFSFFVKQVISPKMTQPAAKKFRLGSVNK
jgi:hypothetical protein